jgi:hypothetical protein
MCTLVIAFGVWPDAPLVVAANRDERLNRPAEAPAVREHAGRLVVAPLDLQAGGTWIAIGERGVFSAVTNRHDPAYFGRIAPRSRGELPLHAAAADDARSGAAGAATTDPQSINPFHLVVADREAAFVVWSDGREVHHEALAPGIHVVTERSYGAADPSRERGLHARLAAFSQAASPPPREVWRAELSQHGTDPFSGTCVHADALGYGTRASTYVRLGALPPALELFHAEGRPCVTPWRDLSALLPEAMRAQGRGPG